MLRLQHLFTYYYRTNIFNTIVIKYHNRFLEHRGEFKWRSRHLYERVYNFERNGMSLWPKTFGSYVKPRCSLSLSLCLGVFGSASKTSRTKEEKKRKGKKDGGGWWVTQLEGIVFPVWKNNGSSPLSDLIFSARCNDAHTQTSLRFPFFLLFFSFNEPPALGSACREIRDDPYSYKYFTKRSELLNEV